MMRYLLIVATLVLFVGAGRAQETKRPPETSAGKVKVEDTKPEKFDMFFKIKEDKFDSNIVKTVVQAMMLRLNTTGLVPATDYTIFYGHDTVQVRMMNNKRDVSDWYSLLVRQGVLRIHLSNDSMYYAKVDTTKIPKGYIAVSEPDMKTMHYVQDRILNGQLIQLVSSIEKFDSPALSGVVVPKDTAYKSFLFTKGMRFATLVDGVVYTTAIITSDSAALNQFPIMQQYPAALTYVIDRVVRYPFVAPVDFLGWRKTEEK